jgi:hypothetical protein
MITGLAAGFYRTLLFVFEKLNQLRYGCFLDTEPLLTGMIDREISGPW